VKRNVGFLPENPPVYPEMQVADYLDFAARLHHLRGARAKAGVDNAISRTGLGDVRNRLIGNLSKGFRQRVGLAQALIHNPQVLILDEPTVGLDPRQIIEIRELIRSLGGEHTVILSSHILQEVTETCQHIIVINRGRIVADDSLENLTRGKDGRTANLTLVVRKATPEGIDAIRAIPGIKSANAAGNRVLIETVPGGPDAREQVVAAAVSRGMGVLEFSSEKASLEDIFLRLITSDAGA
jgi:ABC-2 type transport system ATP-binding protein